MKKRSEQTNIRSILPDRRGERLEEGNEAFNPKKLRGRTPEKRRGGLTWETGEEEQVGGDTKVSRRGEWRG